MSEAARLLSVDPSRVRALVTSGRLSGRRVGSQWVVDRVAVEQRRVSMAAGAVGRPMVPRIAWGAAHLLNHGSAPWLTSSEKSRLRTRMRSHPADRWPVHSRWLATRQTSVTRYLIGDKDIELLLAEDGVVATGVSAAAGYRIGLGASGQGDAYVTGELAKRLIAEFFLIPSVNGLLTLRVVEGGWHLQTAQTQAGQVLGPRLMVAIDLVDLGDARSIATGTALLAELLDGLAGPARGAIR